MAFGFAGVAQAQQAPGFKIAYVNLPKFAEKSNRHKAVEKKLRDFMAQKQTEFEKKKENLLSLQEELKKQGPMLKEDTQNAKIKEIGIKEMELKLFEKQAQTQIQNEQREIMEVFRRDITKIIADIRKEKNYTLIFTSDALLGADESMDITDEVVRIYDAQAPAAAAGAKPEPKAPAGPKPPAQPPAQPPAKPAAKPAAPK
jgi:Skp family chaperone for outer membrane proteins